MDTNNVLLTLAILLALGGLGLGLVLVRLRRELAHLRPMYVPAESVYQEILAQEGEDGMDLLHHALDRRVVPVSPLSFYAYLQVIMLGLRGLNIESRAQEIMQRLGLIQRRLARFAESFETLARHLSNAQRQADEASRRLAQVEASVDELAGGSVEVESAALDRPGE